MLLMEALPQDVSEAQSAFEGAITTLKEHLDTLSSLSMQSAPPLQQAQLHVAIMQSALAIGGARQALDGGSADSAVFAAEHTSLKAYQAKVQKAVAHEELKGTRKHMEINIDAAHRFITHAIPELSQHQKQGLKEVAAQSTSRLNKPSLLAQQRKPVHETVRAARGQTAVERLRSRILSPESGKSRVGSKRDAAEAFLDELDAS